MLQAATAARGRDTVFILTGDNGMSWGMHGFPLKRNPWATELPLYVAGPGIRHGSTNALQSQIDIGPTLAELGGAVMPWADGRSFAGVLWGQSGGRQWMIEDQPHAGYTGGRFHKRWRAVRTLRWHLIRYGDANYLYDLNADPWELTNVITDNRGVFRRLRALFPFWWRGRAWGGSPGLFFHRAAFGPLRATVVRPHAASEPSRRSLLHHHQAAVDGEHLARDVRRLVRGQERDRVGDLVGRAEAAERRALGDLLLAGRRSDPVSARSGRTPGATALTVMPRDASSRAAAFVSPIRPALADE